MNLTENERQVYDLIRKSIEEGYPPTVREICAKLGFKSTSTAHRYIASLTKKGLIEKGDNQNRAIRLAGKGAARIPLVGKVTAGQPITAIEDITDYISFQPAKSYRCVIRYVTKDGNYISNLDVKSAIAKKGKMKKEDLLRDVDELLDEGIITPMQVASWYKNSCVYKMLINGKKVMPEVMPEKRRHLWIWGSSNTGKTTLLRNQMKEKGYDNFFQIPSNNDWVGYNDQYYLYFDEYKGQLTIQELNKICDGGAKMNVKGGSVMLRYDVQVIILSNFSIEECYNRAPKIYRFIK